MTIEDADLVFSKLRELARRGDAAGLRDLLWHRAESIREYLLSFTLEGAPNGFIEQYVTDALARFLRTLEFVPLPPGKHVLEIGSCPYLFQLLFRRVFPDCEVRGVNFFDHNIFATEPGELTQNMCSEAFGESYDFTSALFNIDAGKRFPFPERSFDLVFFCETLEHLIVDPLSTFGKIRRILKPGGHVIITLPNAVRLANIAWMLSGRNFFDMYSCNGPHGRHNREFSLEEVVHLLRENGYRVPRAETYDRCDYDLVDIVANDYAGSVKVPWTRTQVLELLRRAGATTGNRGDNLYLLAERPME